MSGIRSNSYTEYTETIAVKIRDDIHEHRAHIEPPAKRLKLALDLIVRAVLHGDLETLASSTRPKDILHGLCSSYANVHVSQAGLSSSGYLENLTRTHEALVQLTDQFSGKGDIPRCVHLKNGVQSLERRRSIISTVIE